MIVNYWPSWFRALYGGDWPLDYCCVDLETTGYLATQDVITQWGHCLVQDGKVIDQISLVIDWTEHAVVPDHWLSSRLNCLRQGMEIGGKKCHMSYARMKQEGMKPDKAFKFILQFTDTIRKKGIPFVLHGGVFDEKMLCANVQGFVNPNLGFTLGDNGWIDTEGVEKASQDVHQIRFHPQKNDTLRKYWHRVKYTRVNGLKSNLDDHCFRKYKFQEEHGIEPKQMHDAKVDSFCCHLLMEKFRALIRPTPETPPYPSADHKEARKGKTIVMPRPGPLVALSRVRGQRRT